MSEHKIVPNFELIKALSANVKGWLNVNQAWEETECEVTIAKVGAIDEDGNKYPVISVNCSDYYADDDSIKVAQYIAAVNPETITNIIEYSESLQSENERLRAQVGELLALVASKDKFISDAFLAHPNLDLDIECFSRS